MSVLRLTVLLVFAFGILSSADGEVIWRDDLEASLKEAQSSSRPLFVTFRCLPCKQCASFDKDVLEGGPELTPLLTEFVTVRLTDAAQLDGRYFPYRGFQDLDLSWWGYFLSPQGKLYGVFGGKDHISDSTRISEAALVNTMQRILKHHQSNGSLVKTVPIKSPKQLVAFESYSKPRSHVSEQACLHCHQVADVLTTEAIDAGTFVKKDLNEKWPLPENIGLVLDRDHGLLVTEVQSGSAAEAAGFKVGDVLTTANLGETNLFSQADFRGVLHRASPGASSIDLSWLRNGKLQSGIVVTAPGWKTGPNWWRKSVYDGVYGPYLGFFPLHGRGQGKGRLSIKPFMGKDPAKNPWWQYGLRPNQEIIEVGGQSDDWNNRQLLSWFRLNYQHGDDLVLKVRSKGKESEITGKVPAPKTH